MFTLAIIAAGVALLLWIYCRKGSAGSGGGSSAALDPYVQQFLDRVPKAVDPPYLELLIEAEKCLKRRGRDTEPLLRALRAKAREIVPSVLALPNPIRIWMAPCQRIRNALHLCFPTDPVYEAIVAAEKWLESGACSESAGRDCP